MKTLLITCRIPEEDARLLLDYYSAKALEIECTMAAERVLWEKIFKLRNEIQNVEPVEQVEE